MLSSNVKLSLISISLAFILIIFFMIVAPKSRKLQHTVNDKISNINAFVSESIHGIRITQSFNREKENENILKLETGNGDWAQLVILVLIESVVMNVLLA